MLGGWRSGRGAWPGQMGEEGSGAEVGTQCRDDTGKLIEAHKYYLLFPPTP